MVDRQDGLQPVFTHKMQHPTYHNAQYRHCLYFKHGYMYGDCNDSVRSCPNRWTYMHPCYSVIAKHNFS